MSNAPVITTTSLPNGTVGTAYTTTLTATGGAPSNSGGTGGTGGTVNLTWGLSSTSSALPNGLSLASNGTISGTPASGATSASNLIFMVSDGVNAPVSSQPLTLTITGTGLSTADWIGIGVAIFFLILIIIIAVVMSRRSTPAPQSIQMVPTNGSATTVTTK